MVVKSGFHIALCVDARVCPLVGQCLSIVAVGAHYLSDLPDAVDGWVLAFLESVVGLTDTGFDACMGLGPTIGYAPAIDVGFAIGAAFAGACFVIWQWDCVGMVCASFLKGRFFVTMCCVFNRDQLFALCNGCRIENGDYHEENIMMTNHANTHVLMYAQKGLIVSVILLGFYILARLCQAMIDRCIHKGTLGQHAILAFLGRTCKWFILGLGLLTALGTIGVNVSALVASLGLTGFGLGFALKDSLSSLSTGVMLMLRPPFAIGDAITLLSQSGVVKSVDFSYVTLMTDSGSKILVPNSVVAKELIEVKAKVKHV